MEYRELFRILVKEQGSDLIIKANGCPAMRVQGQIKFVSESKVPPQFAQNLADQVIPASQRRRFEQRGELDCSYVVDEVGRFRANIFRQQGALCLVFRHVADSVPSMTELHLPEKQLEALASQHRGRVGKSRAGGTNCNHLGSMQGFRAPGRGFPCFVPRRLALFSIPFESVRKGTARTC